MIVYPPGSQYLTDQISVKKGRVWRLFGFYTISAFIIFIILWANYRNIYMVFVSAVITIILFTFVDKEFELFKHITRNYRSGFWGELSVKRELLKLDDSYKLNPDVHLNGDKENVDFIIRGPTGIFAIEVKNERVDLTNEDQIKKSHLHQAMHGALKLHEFFLVRGTDVFVTPILVYSRRNSRVNLGDSPINNVFVVQRRWINKIILNNKRQK